MWCIVNDRNEPRRQARQARCGGAGRGGRSEQGARVFADDHAGPGPRDRGALPEIGEGEVDQRRRDAMDQASVRERRRVRKGSRGGRLSPAPPAIASASAFRCGRRGTRLQRRARGSRTGRGRQALLPKEAGTRGLRQPLATGEDIRDSMRFRAARAAMARPRLAPWGPREDHAGQLPRLARTRVAETAP
jgi:hypothetical protein